MISLITQYVTKKVAIVYWEMRGGSGVNTQNIVDFVTPIA